MNSYPSKAAQQEAIDSLNRQYDALSRSFPYSADIPYSLHNYRPAKHDRHLSAEVVLKIKGLLAARDAIKATPIVKPVSKQQEREAAITLKFGDNPSLKAAMLKYAPTLARQYADGWESEIARRLKRGDNRLEYIGYYGKDKEVDERTRTENNERYEFWQNAVERQFCTRDGKVRMDKLAAAAKQYGEKTALGWYWKMATKLGKATCVTTVANPQYVTIRVEGIVDGRLVVVNQDIVYKVSSKGTPFHQFPARIYVDGQFTTEAEFAERFHPEEQS